MESEFDLKAWVEGIAERAALRAVEAREGETVTLPTVPAEPLVPARMAAEHVGISERQLRQLVAEGKVPCYRFGEGSVRFKLSELEAHARVAERKLKKVS